MIIFKQLKYKNFLSSGNSITTIDLNRDKTTLVVGHNGAGKSTMLDALSFALFGKAHRDISKNQLINSINKKHTEVQVTFSIGVNHYKVIRGIKPNTFEIWKNDVMLNQSSHAKEYQKILEQNILKLNHKSFHQVVVLGSSSFIPFMQLPGGHRRQVIEDLLDINIFSKMNIIIKEKNIKLKTDISETNHKIELNKTKVDTQQKYIKDIKALTEENKRDYRERIEKAQSEINTLQSTNNDLTTSLGDRQATSENELKKLHERKNTLLMNKSTVQTKMSDLGAKAKFFEDNETCPTCEQTITLENKANMLKQAKVDAKHLTSEKNHISLESQKVADAIEVWDKEVDKVRNIINDITQNNTQISNLQNTINDYQNHLASEVSADLTKAESELEEYLSNDRNLLEHKLSVSEQYSYNNVIIEMLKDTGIKTKIIKQYLPVMNKLVNQYLQVLDFFVHFHLDESFQEVIRSRHRDEFSYDSFSEGEKQRIDLSLLFTWRQIAKMKNSVATNLLLLDETFDSSLDHDGVENLLKILYTFGEDTNVFVISHKGEILDGKFASKIEFAKQKNFSVMKSGVQTNEFVV